MTTTFPSVPPSLRPSIYHPDSLPRRLRSQQYNAKSRTKTQPTVCLAGGVMSTQCLPSIQDEPCLSTAQLCITSLPGLSHGSTPLFIHPRPGYTILEWSWRVVRCAVFQGTRPSMPCWMLEMGRSISLGSKETVEACIVLRVRASLTFSPRPGTRAWAAAHHQSCSR